MNQKEFLTPCQNWRAVESSVTILTLLYEHNEMSPLMLLLITKALFRKKKHKWKNRNLCSCWMQNNKKHFDNMSFFSLLINHKLVEGLSKNERKNAHRKYVCTDWKNYNHNACWNYLKLWSQFTFVVFQIRHDKNNTVERGISVHLQQADC